MIIFVWAEQGNKKVQLTIYQARKCRDILFRRETQCERKRACARSFSSFKTLNLVKTKTVLSVQYVLSLAVKIKLNCSLFPFLYNLVQFRSFNFPPFSYFSSTMPVLRSREVPTLPPKPRKTRPETIDPPATPTQAREQPATLSLTPSLKTAGSVPVSAPSLRRSLRLSSKGSSSGNQADLPAEEKSVEIRNGDVSKKRKLSVDDEESEEVLSLRSGKKVTKRSPLDGGDEKVESEKKGKSSFSREDKGKEKVVIFEIASESSDWSSDDGSVSDVELPATTEVESPDENLTSNSYSRTEGFRSTARQHASRFAFFNADDELGNTDLSTEFVTAIPSEQQQSEENVVEDWPGPFSTAMKIIRDRAANLRSSSKEKLQQQSLQINWIPRKGKGKDNSKRSLPSLLDMTLKVLVDNADAIASLDHVPDGLRNKICHMLCDSRRMNRNFLDILLSGSPAEIRLRECSWLTEDQFNQSFEKCNTNSLTVLQLDYCGQCLTDYVLPCTLARSPNSLPVLTTLSLTGAYRLSDDGLRAFIASAPALRSVNLNQCSFLTHGAIDIIATSLASVLLELFIDDCQNIDAVLMLPALKKLEHLEVLSVAGLESVNDSFIKEFIIARGIGIKGLILTGCRKLTDSSLKIVAETCSNLHALDIGNVPKLTDSSFGYLASGCRSLESLKLCRNVFSDDAIAAFLEMSGEVLKELELNNVAKVGHNTALSLARRLRNVVSLDLSWCRNLTDEAMGLIVDSCSSLRVLKIFGCTQITNVFLFGHSNAEVEIIGLKLSPLLKQLKAQDEGPLQYSAV